MSLHSVPDLRLTVAATEWPSNGRYSRDSQVTFTVADPDPDPDSDSVIAMRAETESGQVLTEQVLTEPDARTLLVLCAAPATSTGLPGLTQELVWELGGTTVGSEWSVPFKDFGLLADWLAFALGDELWDFDEMGDTFEG